MRYSQFDVEYFDSAFDYVAPKMMGCLGIAFVYVLAIVLLIVIIRMLHLPTWANILPGVLAFFILPVIAWSSVRFDGWHNRRQRQRKTGR